MIVITDGSFATSYITRHYYICLVQKSAQPGDNTDPVRHSCEEGTTFSKVIRSSSKTCVNGDGFREPLLSNYLRRIILLSCVEDRVVKKDDVTGERDLRGRGRGDRRHHRGGHEAHAASGDLGEVAEQQEQDSEQGEAEPLRGVYTVPHQDWHVQQERCALHAQQ